MIQDAAITDSEAGAIPHMDEGYGCIGVIVFLAVWIGCSIAWGALGFMLGWMPALFLAYILPLVAYLGVVAILIGAVLLVAAILFSL